MPGGIAAQAMPEAAPPADPSTVLTELRAKMERLKEGSRQLPARRAENTLRGHDRADPSGIDTLPFLPEMEGRLHVRRMTLTRSHRVGVVPCELALAADPSFLALLALDPAVGACSFRNALYLDLETTGLGQGSIPFLCGLMHAQGEELVLEQLLLKNLDDEAALLERVAARVAAASVLITFNGKSFDWPLLRGRYLMNRLAAPTPPTHLDLLHVAKRVHRSPDVPRSIKLQQLEIDLLGLERVGDIPGADIGAAYWHWLRTGQDEVMTSVVDHNAWDVYAMAALVGLYGRRLDTELEPGSARGLHDFLPQVAWTLKRAGAVEEARRVADRAVERGGGTHAYLTRAEIAKALRDRDAALADFEQVLACESRSASSARSASKARLELAKLYEHHVRSYGLAKAVAEAGTGEDQPALARRLERLERKQAAPTKAGRTPRKSPAG